MGFRTIYKWLCVFLLFAASALLLATTISSPVIGDIAILKVLLTNHTDIRHSSVTFGTFGHCVLDVPPDNTDQDLCFPKSVGYNPARIMAEIDGGGIDYTGASTADNLTSAMILHPIALAFTFLAFILSLIPGRILPWFVTLITLIAFAATLAVTAIDFALFGIIKNHVNNDGSGSNAFYSIGMWTCLAALVCLVLPVFFGCCARTKKDKSKSKQFDDNNYQAQPAYV